RREGGAVRARQGLRRPRRRRRRHGAVQHRLDRRRHPAPPGRDRRPATVDQPRPGMSGAATPAAGTTRLAETEAVLELRHAVRAWLTQHDLGAEVAVALSGGADSLALTAAAVVECAAVDALIVDHGLQPGSAAVAATAAAT